MLGYANAKDALANHVDTEDKIMGSQNATPYIIDSIGRKQYPTFINESGVYSLIFSSKMPKAKDFKHWVTSEVLPSIRKTGSYNNSMQIPFDEQVESLETVAKMLNMNEASKLLMLEKFYKQYDVPTDFLPKYELNGNRQLKSLSALLDENGCDLSAKKFNLLLLNCGYLEEKERPTSKGEARKFKALTEKGLVYGENALNTHNQKEVQPLYYCDTFKELYNSVAQGE